MAAPRLPGYRRESGTARGYVGPAGERVSYRQYRAAVERAGLVQRLEAADLANRRRSQRAFNDIIGQMAKVKARAIEQQIENLEAVKRSASPARQMEVAGQLAELRTQKRHVKSTAIKSQTRKEALADVKTYHHKSDAVSQAKMKEALTTLGRREGIPDWVPVGASDDFRRGMIRPARHNNRGRLA